MHKIWVRALVVVLTGALFFAALGVTLTWAPDVPVDQLKARWARPPSRFLAVEGMQVHLRDEGPHDDPAPIVLLHGTSSSLHTWDGWAKALRERRRVIRFDLPGFGLTGPRPDQDYSTQAYVGFVRAVLDQLEVQHFVVGGNSLGGQIAWAMAAAMPDRVAGLVLVDASGYPRESLAAPASVPLGFRIAATPGLRLLAEYTLPRGVVERSVRNVYGDPSKVTPELVDQYMAMALREGNRRALVRRIEQGNTGQLELLGRIKAPTLILWGGRDRLTPPELGQRFAAAIAGSRLVAFDDLGHVPQEEDPQRTVDELRRFLGI